MSQRLQLILLKKLVFIINFINLCRDKTAILVTHRLGSAKIADRIIVMKDGKIIQDGTHDQLIQINGEYKTMYNAQSKWYTE